MLYFLYFLSVITASNNNFVIKKIYDDKVFYNFVSYENALYVSSNKGVFKINSVGNLALFNESVVGPINSILEKNKNFTIRFIKTPELYPKIYSNSVTDFAYLEDNLLIIASYY